MRSFSEMLECCFTEVKSCARGRTPVNGRARNPVMESLSLKPQKTPKPVFLEGWVPARDSVLCCRPRTGAQHDKRTGCQKREAWARVGKVPGGGGTPRFCGLFSPEVTVGNLYRAAESGGSFHILTRLVYCALDSVSLVLTVVRVDLSPGMTGYSSEPLWGRHVCPLASHPRTRDALSLRQPGTTFP